MSSKKFLEGKKILFTNHSYALFGGAELNSVELAEQLVEFGATPTFFSYDIDGPLAAYINTKFNTNVLTDSINPLAKDESVEELQYTELNIEDYDYIWVCANMIPISIIKQINTATKLPKFVFTHMSSLVGFPLDAPLLPEFEKEISTKIISISDEVTEDSIIRILGEDITPGKWYNPAPKGFRFIKKRSGRLRRIAVVSSSYPTDEIVQIKKIIEAQDIQIDYIGRYNNNMKMVNPEFYDYYDLIIGIGKNVKYSLVSGVPVYMYGRFGGCGYLSEENYDIANKNNFSGRGFDQKTAKQIADDIVTNYHQALQFHEKNRSKFIQEFSLDILAKDLFKELEAATPRRVSFRQEYINWLVSTQINLMQRMHYAGMIREMEYRIESSKQELIDCKETLVGLHNSRSWRLTRPMRVIRNYVRKVLKKQ